MSSITSPASSDHDDIYGPFMVEASTATDVPARASRLNGALVGAAAALAASGVMLWAGRSWDGAVLPQLISDRMTGIIPVSMFGQALGALESNAKALTLVMLTLLQVGLGALVGWSYARYTRSDVNRIRRALLLTAGVWAFLSFVAAPLGQIGLLAVNAPVGAWSTQGVFVLTASIFGVLLAVFVPWPVANAHGTQAVDESRRGVLRLAGISALAVPALAAAWYTGDVAQSIRRKSSIKPSRIEAPVTSPSDPGTDAADTPVAPPEGFQFAGMPLEVTPNDEFYVVSKNISDPTVEGIEWSLEISGLVERPMNLSLTDVQMRESGEFSSTLLCISNPVGGNYISTAVWTGFPLAELLEEAGIKDGIVDIELHAADGYIESIPLAEALAPDTMLVHTINGEELPDEHGYPLRLIVPGIYGMKNVKWIEKIIAVDHDVIGFWQERGWSDIATVQTMSRIDTPQGDDKLTVGVPFRAGGVAFGSDRGIATVEVSFDDGDTWQEAELDEPLAKNAWRLWAINHTPATTGRLSIAVRATDGTGTTQTEEKNEPLPDGASGLHQIKVKVEGADA